MKKFRWARRGAAGFIMMAATVLFLGSQSGPAPEVRWLVRFQDGLCYDVCRGVAADASGAYLIGQSCRCVPGEHYLECAGDSFIAKLDPSGNELWRTPITVNTNCQAWGIALYGAHLYVCGRTKTAVIDWPWVLWKTFVAKFDLNGSQLASVELGAGANQNNGGIAVDSTGVYVVDGAYQNLPGFQWDDLNAFLYKLDHDLNPDWTREIGTDGFDNAWGVATNATGVYVTGDTRGDLDYPDADPFHGTPNGADDTDWDVFVVKFGAAGNELWRTQFGTAFIDGRPRISLFGPDVYVCGFTQGSFPGFTNAGEEDAFVARLSAGGGVLDIAQYGTARRDSAQGIAVDATGIYLVGCVGNQFPDQSEAFSDDAYVAKFNSNLDMDWVKQFGTYAPDEGWGIALSPAGIYASGCVEADWNDEFHANDFKGFAALLAYPYISVDIDIKPGDFPNAINLKSKGNVPVAVFGKAGFDAASVNPLTVTLAGAPVILKNNGSPMASFEDVNRDGFMDLVLHFDTTALRLTKTDTQAELEGRTYDGRAIKGVDSVKII